MSMSTKWRTSLVTSCTPATTITASTQPTSTPVRSLQVTMTEYTDLNMWHEIESVLLNDPAPPRSSATSTTAPPENATAIYNHHPHHLTHHFAPPCHHSVKVETTSNPHLTFALSDPPKCPSPLATYQGRCYSNTGPVPHHNLPETQSSTSVDYQSGSYGGAGGGSGLHHYHHHHYAPDIPSPWTATSCTADHVPSNLNINLNLNFQPSHHIHRTGGAAQPHYSLKVMTPPLSPHYLSGVVGPPQSHQRSLGPHHQLTQFLQPPAPPPPTSSSLPSPPTTSPFPYGPHSLYNDSHPPYPTSHVPPGKPKRGRRRWGRKK